MNPVYSSASLQDDPPSFCEPDTTIRFSHQPVLNK